MSDEIVILGCGIIGLYTGLVLAKQDKTPHITYVAEYYPGDQSINYTSPWAGANFSSISGDNPKALRHDRISYQMLSDIFDQFGEEAGLLRLPAAEYWAADALPDKAKFESQKDYIPDLLVLDDDELPPNVAFGISYTTYNFNAPKFLTFLYGNLRRQGASFVRRKVSHIEDAFLSRSTKLVFNCTGLGARKLGGVEDINVYPVRGQVVVVRAPHVQQNLAISRSHSLTYIIPRPFSGGHVILGGYYQEHNWCGDTYGYETESIVLRAKVLLPELEINGQPIEIIREAAGLRPARKGGNRIEKQVLSGGRTIIHNYGAAGTGYQSGYAMALEAVELMSSAAKL